MKAKGDSSWRPGSERRREIGLRLALGANHAAVAIAVARRCLINVSAGALAGLVVFWGMRRVLSTMLFEISPGDPLAVTVAISVLALVAAFASWIPARLFLGRARLKTLADLADADFIHAA